MEYEALDEAGFNDLASRIVYEDNHLLVLNKRVGEIVQGDKTGDEPLCDTLKAFIAQRDSKPGKVFMGVPHRLDRPVSGLCIFAKTSKGLERLSEMFRAGNVHKTYWALCCAEPPCTKGADGTRGEDKVGNACAEDKAATPDTATLLENWMTRNEKQNKSYIVKEGTPGAKLARLKYRLAGRTQRYFLIEVELLTGRHHQIRCQLAHIGCPIKGDLKYGAPRSNPNGGICLHARSITFIHPVRKEEIHIEAPVPADWPDID